MELPDNKVVNMIENIKVLSVKNDLQFIHANLKEINVAKSNAPGHYFENKLNRLKRENAAEYMNFRTYIMPLILETDKLIEDFMEVVNNSSFDMPVKLKEYLEENKTELELDARIIKKYSFDKNTSFLK